MWNYWFPVSFLYIVSSSICECSKQHYSSLFSKCIFWTWHPSCNTKKWLRLSCAAIGKLGRQRRRCSNQVLHNPDTQQYNRVPRFPQVNLKLTALYYISKERQHMRAPVSLTLWEYGHALTFCSTRANILSFELWCNFKGYLKVTLTSVSNLHTTATLFRHQAKVLKW